MRKLLSGVSPGAHLVAVEISRIRNEFELTQRFTRVNLLPGIGGGKTGRIVTLAILGHIQTIPLFDANSRNNISNQTIGHLHQTISCGSG